MDGFEIVVKFDSNLRVSASENKKKHCDEEIARYNIVHIIPAGILNKCSGAQRCVEDEPNDRGNTTSGMHTTVVEYLGTFRADPKREVMWDSGENLVDCVDHVFLPE